MHPAAGVPGSLRPGLRAAGPVELLSHCDPRRQADLYAGRRHAAGRPARLGRPLGPGEEDFRSGKGCFGLDQSQVRLFTAIAWHTALVMAALAICAVTAAQLRRRTGTRAPAPI